MQTAFAKDIFCEQKNQQNLQRITNQTVFTCFPFLSISKVHKIKSLVRLVPAAEKIIFLLPGEPLDRLTAELSQKVMQLQNEKLALNLSNQPFQMYQRPGIALDCSSISNAVLKLIDNEELKKLDLLGIAIEQKTDGLDFTDCPWLLAKIIEE